ncbi:MAG: bifunctional 5,10-methylenetetrahydrofolate dehydrogenase/5,10-methenyltetrahydrofolate cyclohydrolase [Bacteriovoracaceae bacterium]
MPTLLKAKPLVELKLEDFKLRTDQLKAKNISPRLEVILVGNNPASKVYVEHKKKKSEKVGVICNINHFDENIEADEFVTKVKEIFNNPEVHGAFIQLPLPKQLSHLETHKLVPAHKDVDGFHPDNVFSTFSGQGLDSALISCTPKGIIQILEHYNIPLEGKNVLVIGRSMIVGRPVAMLCLNENATVTFAHSKTKNLKEQAQNADVLIVAIGRAKFLTEDYLSSNQNQVIVDVGINRMDDGSLAGDSDFENIQDKVSAITPVPGGVGPMTIMSLLDNLILAAERRI